MGSTLRLLVGMAVHSVGGGVVWAFQRLLLPFPSLPVSSLSFPPNIIPFLIPAFTGAFVACYLIDSDEPIFGSVIGFLSGLVGGFGAALASAFAAAMLEGLYYEAGFEIPGFWVFYGSLFFLRELPRQIGIGVLFGPVGGLLGSIARTRRARGAEV